MKPLAYRIRPVTFNDVVGQDHLVGNKGILTKMVERKQIISFILYGNPGTGKTTIAELVAKESGMEYFTFSASTDSKQRLKEIIDTTAYHDILIIVDEIHRMKTDIQDYLLPFLENGKVVIIGLTTSNPYIAINPAIRSRCHLFQTLDIETKDIVNLLKKVVSNNQIDIESDILESTYQYLATSSGGEIRTALNFLEAISLASEETITPEIAKLYIGKPILQLDGSDDNYYELLSAFQKSIRGSDVDAALHYLARLITLGDLVSLTRRLMVIAYEDIGLANPAIGPKVTSACDAAIKLGLPEARIPLSVAVIDCAISPKSNTAIIALDTAISDYQNGKATAIPNHIINREIKKNPSLYKYPHDYKDTIINQTYLPESLLNKSYYIPKDESNYEKALKERLEWIKKKKGQL